MSQRDTVSVSRRNPPTMWNMASLGWSHISVAEPGRLAFVSGQVAVTPGSTDVPEDLASQAKLATSSLTAALEELEASPDDLIETCARMIHLTLNGRSLE